MSDGLGVLLALAAVFVPLLLAWFLIARTVRPRKPSRSSKTEPKTKPKP